MKSSRNKNPLTAVATAGALLFSGCNSDASVASKSAHTSAEALPACDLLSEPVRYADFKAAKGITIDEQELERTLGETVVRLNNSGIVAELTCRPALLEETVIAGGVILHVAGVSDVVCTPLAVFPDNAVDTADGRTVSDFAALCIQETPTV